MLVGDRVEHGQRGGARDGIAAERAAVLARSEGASRRPKTDAGADGQAAAEAFGQSEHVGPNALGEGREPLAGAADAALHLVDHEQRVDRVAGGSRGREVARRRGDDASLAECRLQEDRGGLVGDGRPQRLGVAVVNERHRAGQRLERRALGRVAGDGQCAQRAAVEAVVRGENLATVGQLTDDLQRALVGFGAAVGEKDLSVPAGQLHQPFGEVHPWLVDQQVRRVRQAPHLPLHCGHNRRMRVAERGNGDAAHEDEVFATVHVPQSNAVAVVYGQRRGPVVRHHGHVPPGAQRS